MLVLTRHQEFEKCKTYQNIAIYAPWEIGDLDEISHRFFTRGGQMRPFAPRFSGNAMTFRDESIETGLRISGGLFSRDT